MLVAFVDGCVVNDVLLLNVDVNVDADVIILVDVVAVVVVVKFVTDNEEWYQLSVNCGNKRGLIGTGLNLAGGFF